MAESMDGQSKRTRKTSSPYPISGNHVSRVRIIHLAADTVMIPSVASASI